MKKNNKNKSLYDAEINKPVQLGYLTVPDNSEDEIMSVLSFLSETIKLDSRLEHLDLTKVAPTKVYNMQTCMGIYMDYLATLSPVTNPIASLSTLSERNDVVLYVDRVEVHAEPDDPKAYPKQEAEIKMSVPKVNDIKDIEVLALVVAEIVAYTTTFSDGKMGLIFDAKKAKMLSVPYVPMIKVRQILDVADLQAGQTRDVIYEKLKRDWRLTYVLSNMIYSTGSMKDFAENNIEKLAYYNKNRGKAYPALTTLYVPCVGSFDLDSCSNIETALRFLNVSRGIRGADTRGIGVISVGYMWYDMTRTMFVDLAAAQDLLSLCTHLGLTAIASDSLNARVVKILVANRMNVYSIKASQVQRDSALPGYYKSGPHPYLTFLDLDVEPSIVNSKSIDHPVIGPKLDTLRERRKGQSVTCAYFYIHPKLKTCKLQIFPSFRAHSGLVLVTNIPSEDDDDKFKGLVGRVYEANHCRNMFPFTRVAYCSQDPYFEYFAKSIIIPRNIPRKTTIFASDVEYKKVSVTVRTEYHLDLDVADQVELATNVESITAQFYDELDDLSGIELVDVLRPCLWYPKYLVTSQYFPVLKSFKYDIRADTVLKAKYKDIIDMIDTEEKGKELSDSDDSDEIVSVSPSALTEIDEEDPLPPADDVTSKKRHPAGTRKLANELISSE